MDGLWRVVLLLNHAPTNDPTAENTSNLGMKPTEELQVGIQDVPADGLPDALESQKEEAGGYLDLRSRKFQTLKAFMLALAAIQLRGALSAFGSPSGSPLKSALHSSKRQPMLLDPAMTC